MNEESLNKIRQYMERYTGPALGEAEIAERSGVPLSEDVSEIIKAI